MTLKHVAAMVVSLVLSLSAYAEDGFEKLQNESFKILSKYRVDIPASTLKKAKKEFTTPLIHDSWIENSYGKSIDLQGNELFPEYDYNKCAQLSATHFELTGGYYPGIKGVIRTDGKLIVPIENRSLRYYPEVGIIIAFVDFDPINISGESGTVKVYDYYGTLHKTIENCTKASLVTPYSAMNWGAITTLKWSDSQGDQSEIIRGILSTPTQLENATSFFYEGPQATTFNIIRDLCASEKKGDLKKAIVLLDYYVWKIMPQDGYSREQSRAIWDATCKKISCVLAAKPSGRGGLVAATVGAGSEMATVLSGFDNGVTVGTYRHLFYPDLSQAPILQLVWDGAAHPQVMAMREQADGLLKLAYTECKNQQIRAAEREQMWANVLQVLAGTFNTMAGSVGVQSYRGGTTVNTTASAMPGQRMIDQTTVSPEIMGAAISAGWTPESPSTTSTGTETKSGSSSTSGRTCHACFGSGKHQACNGSGTQLAFGNKRMEKCSQCNGSGKCPQCGGQGHH